MIDWNAPLPCPTFNYYPHQGLTPDEIKVLNLLGEAWNEYVKLDAKHPDDNDDFRRAIHQAQQLIAIRVARRVDPVIWYQPEEKKDGNNKPNGQ